MGTTGKISCLFLQVSTAHKIDVHVHVRTQSGLNLHVQKLSWWTFLADSPTEKITCSTVYHVRTLSNSNYCRLHKSLSPPLPLSLGGEVPSLAPQPPLQLFPGRLSLALGCDHRAFPTTPISPTHQDSVQSPD